MVSAEHFQRFANSLGLNGFMAFPSGIVATIARLNLPFGKPFQIESQTVCIAQNMERGLDICGCVRGEVRGKYEYDWPAVS